MLKKILVLLAMLYAAVAFAAVDVNKGDAAALDGVKGIGPALSKRIVDERKKGDFKSWDDLISRVKGIGDKSALKLSAEGLTVNGDAYKGATAKPDDKKAAKEDKKETKAAAKEEKKEAKADKKEEKAMAKAEKKDDKPMAKADKPTAKEEKAAAKEAKAAAKEEKKEEKAAAAKAAASAKK